jgi:hypothetical protein
MGDLFLRLELPLPHDPWGRAWKHDRQRVAAAPGRDTNAVEAADGILGQLEGMFIKSVGENMLVMSVLFSRLQTEQPHD